MELRELLFEDLVFVNLLAETKEEALTYMAEQLYSQGYVMDSYGDAVKSREVVYPTGIQAERLGVALPHTDVCHVKKAAVAIGVLEKPVFFNEMGNPDHTVEVKLIFMMAIENPTEQVGTLSSLAEVIQDNDKLMQIKNSKEGKEILNVF